MVNNNIKTLSVVILGTSLLVNIISAQASYTIILLWLVTIILLYSRSLPLCMSMSASHDGVLYLNSLLYTEVGTYIEENYKCL